MNPRAQLFYNFISIRILSLFSCTIRLGPSNCRSIRNVPFLVQTSHPTLRSSPVHTTQSVSTIYLY